MIAGIFVGGKSTRMGGFPKGRLLSRDTGEPLIVRSSRLLIALGLTPVLVGDASEYSELLPELPRLSDAPANIGPLGGLGALLAHAQTEHVIALACDMPFLSTALIAKLLSAPAAEDVLAPKGSAGFWEPLCARYRVESLAAPLRDTLRLDERSFRALFRRLCVTELVLDEVERGQLADWDSDEDVKR